MSDEVIKELQRKINDNRLIVVLGTGVSAQVSGNELSTWRGLLSDGIQHCVREHPDRADDVWERLAREGVDKKNVKSLLSVADRITKVLGGEESSDFFRWLKGSVGTLTAKPGGNDVLNAISALNVPICTTNYDGLIERATGRPHLTWMDRLAGDFVRHETDHVLHMHGYWAKPESVVFGTASYERIKRNNTAQAIQRLLYGGDMLVFVGYGSGLTDPNFDQLLKWAGRVFRGHSFQHYRLARASDVADARSSHPAEHRIKVHGYGAKYEDLVPFLAKLRPRPGATPSATAWGSMDPGRAAQPQPPVWKRDLTVLAEEFAAAHRDQPPIKHALAMGAFLLSEDFDPPGQPWRFILGRGLQLTTTAVDSWTRRSGCFFLSDGEPASQVDERLGEALHHFSALSERCIAVVRTLPRELLSRVMPVPMPEPFAEILLELTHVEWLDVVYRLGTRGSDGVFAVQCEHLFQDRPGSITRIPLRDVAKVRGHSPALAEATDPFPHEYVAILPFDIWHSSKHAIRMILEGDRLPKTETM